MLNATMLNAPVTCWEAATEILRLANVEDSLGGCPEKLRARRVQEFVEYGIAEAFNQRAGWWKHQLWPVGMER